MAFPTFDAIENFVATTVATAPSPATSGTSLVVASGTGGNFPATPFDAVAWPSTGSPTGSTAEIVRVTNIVTDTLTITRGAQTGNDSGGINASIAVGWNIARCVMAKDILDTQQAIPEGAIVTSTVATTTTSAISTGLAFAIGSNQTYQFQAFIMVVCSSTTTAGGSKYAVTGPVGATGFYTVEGPVASAATTSAYTSTTTMGSLIGPFAESTAQKMILVNGQVSAAATSGTVTIQFASNATADTTTVESGSVTAFRCA